MALHAVTPDIEERSIMPPMLPFRRTCLLRYVAFAAIFIYIRFSRYYAATRALREYAGAAMRCDAYDVITRHSRYVTLAD